MTPGADIVVDRDLWLWALSGVLSIVVTTLVVVFWRLWGTLATKVELLATKTELNAALNLVKDEIMAADFEHDRVMEERIANRVEESKVIQASMHRENAEMQREMRQDIKALLSRHFPIR